MRVDSCLPGDVRVTKTAGQFDGCETVGKGGGFVKLRVDDKLPGLVTEAPAAAQLHRCKSAGKLSRVVELRIHSIFAVRFDVAIATAASKAIEGVGDTAADLDCRQPLAEDIGLVELRVDRHLPRNIHIPPLVETHGGQSFRENLRPFKLRIDDEFTGTGHKSPATIDDDRVEHLRGGPEGHWPQNREREQHGQA